MDQAIGIGLLFLAVWAARVGLCLYLAGISQSKNAATAVVRTIADLCVSILALWAVGRFVLPVGGSEYFGSAAPVVLIATGAALGSTLGRSRLLPVMAVSAVLAGVVVPLSARWVLYGWLRDLGFIDNGGASFLHLTGGLAAAAGAIAVGPRFGKFNHDGSANHIPGHNIPLAGAGALAMCAGFAGQIAMISGVHALTNCILAGAAGGLAAMGFSSRRNAVIDFQLIVIGLLAGVVSASAGAAVFIAPVAILVGAVGGLAAAWASGWIEMRWHIDDPASAISIHAVGGACGLLAAGLLHPTIALGPALAGIAAIGALSLGASAAILLAFKHTIGLRPGEADELDGTDLSEHDVNAYPDFQQTMIKSHHLRQM
jgi:ammonium transporter, Amt family